MRYTNVKMSLTLLGVLYIPYFIKLNARKYLQTMYLLKG